jgi:hypothetical protein
VAAHCLSRLPVWASRTVQLLSPRNHFFCAPVRLSGNLILACFNPLHIDAHFAIDNKTIFGASASNVGRIRAGNERLCRYASRVRTCATKPVAFNNGDPTPSPANRAEGDGPAWPVLNEDRVEMLRIQRQDS